MFRYPLSLDQGVKINKVVFNGLWRYIHSSIIFLILKGYDVWIIVAGWSCIFHRSIAHSLPEKYQKISTSEAIQVITNDNSSTAALSRKNFRTNTAPSCSDDRFNNQPCDRDDEYDDTIKWVTNGVWKRQVSNNEYEYTIKWVTTSMNTSSK